MGVDGDDGAGGKFGQVERLAADAASEVEDGGGRGEIAAEGESPFRAGAVAGALAGEVLVQFEKEAPEAGGGGVHVERFYGSTKLEPSSESQMV